ncbi:DUF397 domain-containing protein [Actinokineospora iranica]|uniref:DUF397 domain-containing protein n=1 Tax=Actinokineospora iranica TaxID=1271860 RepID=A0A1G6RFK2_9PSEU|nr:DUF397 domain-containing protein [Actinokineospora iranica]SDD02666.1 protein of unknown function [Actinokineospora iranica]
MSVSNNVVWRKSARCESGKCVELAWGGTATFIRDSKNPGQIVDIPAGAARLLIDFVRD